MVTKINYHDHQAPLRGEIIELKLSDVHFTTKRDILEAFHGQCRGDRESRGFLLAIVTAHDQEVLQTMLEFLPKQARYQGRSLLWFLPFRRRLMTTRSNGINEEAMHSIRALPEAEQPQRLMKALEILWCQFYYGVVEYHS